MASSGQTHTFTAGRPLLLRSPKPSHLGMAFPIRKPQSFAYLHKLGCGTGSQSWFPVPILCPGSWCHSPALEKLLSSTAMATQTHECIATTPSHIPTTSTTGPTPCTAPSAAPHRQWVMNSWVGPLALLHHCPNGLILPQGPDPATETCAAHH